MTQKQLLAGYRVLVVEDEFLLADLLQRTLEQFGAVVVGPIGNLPDAMRQAADDGFEVAVIGKRKPTPTFRHGLGLSRLRAVLSEAVRDGRERVLLWAGIRRS